MSARTAARILPLLVMIAAGTLEAATAAGPLDTEVALRGYFVAGSRLDHDAPGGFGHSQNHPKRIDRSVPEKRVSLMVLTDEFARFGASRGFVVVLANATSAEVAFEASDSRLSIVREARDATGQWRPIEYLPQSWCGNSYHRVFLPPGHYWSFAAPEYSGSFRTTMRFVLSGNGAPIYSNEFDGWIHRSQFDKRQGHAPTSIMDPYND